MPEQHGVLRDFLEVVHGLRNYVFGEANMRKLSTCLGVLVLALAQSPYALAGEASETFKDGMQDRHEGMKEIVTSPAHVVEDTAAGIEGDHPVGGTAEGVVTGTAKTGGQIVEGAVSMVEGTGKMISAPIEAVTE